MAFESLSYRYTINIQDLPQRWLPLIHLYDPDLPLFPIYYFHVLEENTTTTRPSDTQRAFGYVERINLLNDGSSDVIIITNKDLNNATNRPYINPVTQAVRERLGLNNPVTFNDISGIFLNELDSANKVVEEIWHRVVANAYGGKLPFGRLWDEVLGLARFVSSWYSSGGRKNELIQTHYFISKFGVQIQSGGGIPQVDFYLLPTITELIGTNPLPSFPDFAKLVRVAEAIGNNYCNVLTIDTINLLGFVNPTGRQLNTKGILDILEGPHIANECRSQAKECYNSFDKGPQRTIIFLLMLCDLRSGRYNPGGLTQQQCGLLYDRLKSSYQSPKVIEIYAQQCWGNPSAMPIDIWIETFFKWPLNILPPHGTRSKHQSVFSRSINLGKLERLLWVAGQARKVHSSACNDILWCLKYASKDEDNNAEPRGANPLSCKICMENVRNNCPAYNIVRARTVVFNKSYKQARADFSITTSAGNNTDYGQTFIKCVGKSTYIDIRDDFSPSDAPGQFATYPAATHGTRKKITVEEFVSLY